LLEDKTVLVRFRAKNLQKPQQNVPMLLFEESFRLSAGVSNSNCSEGQMWAHNLTPGPHYETDATMCTRTLLFTRNSFYKQRSHLISCERYREF